MNDAASPDEDPLLGEVVDERFRLDEKLGEGAVGRVYRATQLSIDRPVAIKVLHGEFRRDDEYQQRFRREARAISSFNHPNIVRLVDYGEDGDRGLTYLAMEYVEGVELYEIKEKGRLDPRCALEITSQVAAGLSAAHEADIIHRDLKASNIILVSVPGGIFQAKVLDFGVAFPKNQSKRMTTDGEVFGTPAYMSPEQARGKPVDPASDLYSLGIVLFEMLTGQLPFDGENTVELMVKHLQNEPPPLRRGLPSGRVPDGLQELLDTMLAKSPDHRPSTGDAVRDRIEEIRGRNNWGALHVDSTLSLEESLEKWVLAEDADRLTTAQKTGRPGSDSRDSLGAADRETAVEGPSGSSRGGRRTDSEAAPDGSESAARGPATTQPADSSSQRSRTDADESETLRSTPSVGGWKTGLLALFVVGGAAAGGIGGYLFFSGAPGAPESASDGTSASAAPARARDAGAEGRVDTGPSAVRRDTSRTDGAGSDARSDARSRPDRTDAGSPAERVAPKTLEPTDEGGAEPADTPLRADDGARGAAGAGTEATGAPSAAPGESTPSTGTNPPESDDEAAPAPEGTGLESDSTGASDSEAAGDRREISDELSEPSAESGAPDSAPEPENTSEGDDSTGGDEEIDKKLQQELEQLDETEF